MPFVQRMMHSCTCSAKASAVWFVFRLVMSRYLTWHQVRCLRMWKHIPIALLRYLWHQTRWSIFSMIASSYDKVVSFFISGKPWLGVLNAEVSARSGARLSGWSSCAAVWCCWYAAVCSWPTTQTLSSLTHGLSAPPTCFLKHYQHLCIWTASENISIHFFFFLCSWDCHYGRLYDDTC